MLTPQQLQILNLISQFQNMTRPKLARMMDLTNQGVVFHLKNLREEGYLEPHIRNSFDIPVLTKKAKEVFD